VSLRKWVGLLLVCLMLVGSMAGGVRTAVADDAEAAAEAAGEPADEVAEEAAGEAEAERTDSSDVPDALPDENQEEGATEDEPEAEAAGERVVGLLGHGAPVIRVYQDTIPWFGENRHHNTLVALGKVLGDDYFIHGTNALPGGIPVSTSVVYISSNASGLIQTRNRVNNPDSQANLLAFLLSGGTLIMSLGDNDTGGGFLTPGSTGTPAYIFPNPCGDVTLTAAAAGHPLVIGPDGIAGTADDLNNNNIDQPPGFCYAAHGNLTDGMTLPTDATLLMTATFGGQQKPVLAEYCVGAGRVIVGTLTNEWQGWQPAGTGPSFLLRNLFHYALSGNAKCRQEVPLDIHPTSCPNPINVNRQGIVPAAVLGWANLDVATIDPASIRLNGLVAPVRWDYEDVATPYFPLVGKELDAFECSDEEADGYLDLTLKFDAQQVAALLAGYNDRDLVVLWLEGETWDGTPIYGEDVIVVINRKK
jgi:hypothetical protein